MAQPALRGGQLSHPVALSRSQAPIGSQAPVEFRIHSLELREIGQELDAISAEAACLDERRNQALQRQTLLVQSTAAEESEAEVENMLRSSSVLSSGVVDYTEETFTWTARLNTTLRRVFKISGFISCQAR